MSLVIKPDNDWRDGRLQVAMHLRLIVVSLRPVVDYTTSMRCVTFQMLHRHHIIVLGGRDIKV